MMWLYMMQALIIGTIAVVAVSMLVAVISLLAWIYGEEDIDE